MASPFITGVAASSEAIPVIEVSPEFLTSGTFVSCSSISLAARISGAHSRENAMGTSFGDAPERSVDCLGVRPNGQKGDCEDGKEFHSCEVDSVKGRHPCGSLKRP